MQPAEINMEKDNTFTPELGTPEQHPRSGRGILSESGVAEMLPVLKTSAGQPRGVRGCTQATPMDSTYGGTIMPNWTAAVKSQSVH